MKPLRTFIFIAAVTLLLFLLALVFPPEGIVLSPGLHLKFASLEEIRRQDSIVKNDMVEQLLAASSVSEDPEADFQPEVHPPVLKIASRPIAGESSARVPTENEPVSREETMHTDKTFEVEEKVHVEKEAHVEKETHVEEPGSEKEAVPAEAAARSNEAVAVAPANVDSLKNAIQPIAYPNRGRDMLYPFFNRLDGLLSGQVDGTRILHFGDSQIEVDRMTSLIRYRLQKQFGGSGTGLVHAMPVYSGSLAYRQEEEGKWLRYTFFGKRDTSIKHNCYGIMGAYTSVPAPMGDQWPSISYRFNTSRRTGQVDRIRVFMHSYVDHAGMAFKVNDSLGDTITNIRDGFSVADYMHRDRIKNLEIALDLPEGGRIYGISFESNGGLQMDNIAMRGASGLVFTRMNRDIQLQMMKSLSPGLLILQYGGNVIPYINPKTYHRAYKEELALLQELCPGVPIIVIGPADMSRKVKRKFESYPGVEAVRNALKDAALESGCAFWDLYDAMGGHNSMPSFVNSDPPLASSDYIHFNKLGINLVAEMFYKALMQEYSQYQGEKRYAAAFE